ncbi:MAG: hypothetical protein KKB08_19020 [Gammaproteobacteria bacterium]|jgi:hypothetical protein|nr:hypothetical protein [Gammaproteobacteria bacterium]MBU1818839.1 hypothetical protein [Gammaproteobacteria bacterium]
MNTSHNVSHPHNGLTADSDPEFGMYDIQIFWLAALVAVVAVIAVAYFKMGY